MGIEAEANRLSQQKFLKDIGRTFNPTEMITVYLSDCTKLHHYGIYCALIPNGQLESALDSTSWELSHGEGLPGSSVYLGDEKNAVYHRFGSDDGVEPLIIDRYFNGLREDYREICEEFRFFHRLFHDRKQDCYLKFDDAGNEHIIAIFESNSIQIRLKELREFLAIKEMHLSIQFDCRVHSEYTLKEIGEIGGDGDHRENLLVWSLHFGEFGASEVKSFSRLLGKRLVPPLPKEKSGFWGFAEEKEKRYADFIIGLDESGEEISHNSDPDALGIFFGANPNAPNYLTPVYFRKQVLDKYYQQPGKYSVEDSRLFCGALWGMQLDNHHDDKVCAWLGDLGRDLPYEEQLHWRSHNIPSTGGVSETYYKRQLLGEFADSERPEHLFNQKYEELQRECDNCLSWRIILPLSREDQHFQKGIRIPATDEQKDFDELILALTKIIIDSLNEKELCKLLSKEDNSAIKGSIARLEGVFRKSGLNDFENHISFLRKLQNLRSSSSAHRKGSNYQKVAKEFGIEESSLRNVLGTILQKALDFLEFLIHVVQSKKLNQI